MQDMSGQKFGKLTVTRRADDHFTSGGKRITMYLCTCDCGNTKIVRRSALVTGKALSCGCHTRVGKLIDLTGSRFGRLTVIGRHGAAVDPSGNKRPTWLCRCDCGAEKAILGQVLREGRVVSCGCYVRELARHNGKENIQKAIQATIKHHESKTRLYAVWRGIKSRTHNPNCKSYKIYGGRGIKMCPEWYADYVAFRDWSLANGYDKNAKFGECTIDRIDTNGNYVPSNCKWSNMSQQAFNRRKAAQSEVR